MRWCTPARGDTVLPLTIDASSDVGMLRSTETDDRRRRPPVALVRRGVVGRDDEVTGELLTPIRGETDLGDGEGVETEPRIAGRGLVVFARREPIELAISSVSARLPSMKEVRRDRIMYLAPIPGGGLATLGETGIGEAKKSCDISLSMGVRGG
ncbi:hypothetical protein BC938DRAFT_480838 [Jimgerdemannia flammicorona]|uniref:Uncharacterized protein n=1 Tax=Jimgerdemannia flammicorona TaxID=994334 RepID=A0A433QHK8_9FUNG|nr:hypothetical protein BC938DRAFT_480838 [Jimgerdemannia flammicorona]